jgi:hypothetical protein
MPPAPDEELKRKLLEFIGGKIAKSGDSYEKGSALFTKAASSLISGEEDSSPKQGRNKLGSLRLRSYEPILGTRHK